MQILNEMQDDALAEGEDIGLHRSVRLTLYQEPPSFRESARGH